MGRSVGVLLAVAVLGAACSSGSGGADLSKIRSCDALHAYYEGAVRPGLDIPGTPAEQRANSARATAVNVRAEQLGGCPGSDNW